MRAISSEIYMAEKKEHMFKSDALASDLPCQSALQLSCRDLHQLNIYTIWMLSYRVRMSLCLPYISLTGDDLKKLSR